MCLDLGDLQQAADTVQRLSAAFPDLVTLSIATDPKSRSAGSSMRSIWCTSAR